MAAYSIDQWGCVTLLESAPERMDSRGLPARQYSPEACAQLRHLTDTEAFHALEDRTLPQLCGLMRR